MSARALKAQASLCRDGVNRGRTAFKTYRPVPKVQIMSASASDDVILSVAPMMDWIEKGVYPLEIR